MVTAGPDQATYQSNGRGGVVRSQIDHILGREDAVRLAGCEGSVSRPWYF